MHKLQKFIWQCSFQTTHSTGECEGDIQLRETYGELWPADDWIARSDKAESSSFRLELRRDHTRSPHCDIMFHLDAATMTTHSVIPCGFSLRASQDMVWCVPRFCTSAFKANFWIMWTLRLFRFGSHVGKICCHGILKDPSVSVWLKILYHCKKYTDGSIFTGFCQ